MANADIAARAAERVGEDNDAGERIEDIHDIVAAAAKESLTPPKEEVVEDKPKETEEKPKEVETAPKAKEEVEEGPAARKDSEKEVEAPSNWSAKDKATFKRLPEDARSFLLDRHKAMEGDYTKKSQALADERRQFEGFVQETAPVAKLFEPYRAQMKQAGFTMESMVRAWMAVESDLLAGKGVEVLRKVAKAYNIPLDKLVEAPAAKVEPGKEGAPPPVDPALLGRLDKLEASEQQRERELIETETQRVTQEFNSLVAKIDEFEAAKDEQGNLLHPYWKDVINDIAATIHGYRSTGQAIPSLDDLYNRAIWANPVVRAKLQAAADEAAEAKRQAAARTKTAQAKKTGVSVTGSNRGGGQPAARFPQGGSPASNSIDDDVRAAARQVRESAAI